MCIEDVRSPKKLFYGELQSEMSKINPKKRFDDVFKITFRVPSVDLEEWEQMIENRSVWKSDLRLL